MFLAQLTTNILLFIIGLVGIVMNRRNILIILMCVERCITKLKSYFLLYFLYISTIYMEPTILFIYFNCCGSRIRSRTSYYNHILPIKR